MREVSIIIPAHNEEKTIAPLIERIFKVEPKAEIIVVDDNSTDNTANIVAKLQRKYKSLRLLKKEGPKGKTTSLLQGFSAAKGKILVMIDADLQYPPEAIPKMVKEIKDGKADIVIGKRIFREIPFLRRFLSFCFTLFFGRILLGIPATDIQTAEKAFRKEVLQSIVIKSRMWSFDVEFLYKANKKGWRIAEIPILFVERKGGVSKVRILNTICDLARTSLILFIKGSE